MKRIFLTVSLIVCFAFAVFPQESGIAEKKWWEDIKQTTTFGGYIIGQASFNDQDLDDNNESHSDFDLRLVRAYVNGQVWDFTYRLQLEMTGVAGSSSEKGVRILDAYTEWCKYSFLKIKFGQFKRGFTFENPMNPWDIGFGSYSQTTTKLAGMSDRVGEQSNGGRDVGVQIQGDLFRSKRDGHNWLHYQVGVFNGQGINHSDSNNNKDVIGGIWVCPVNNLCIGAFGWAGKFSKDDSDGNKITVDRNRMALGLKYESKWTVRGEYVTSEGHKISDYTVNEDGTMTVTGRDKADAWYATVGVPATNRCKIYAKWDVYRDRKNNSTKKSIYNLSVNYYFFKNLKIQGIYGFVDDNTSSGDQHYNTFDLQVYVRF